MVRLIACAVACLILTGADAQPILIGQTIATSGSLAEHGRGLVLGASAHFALVNKAGGIHGRPIELRTLDDGGDSARAAANTKTLVSDPAVLVIFSGAEGGPCVASLQAATEARIVQLGCAAGSPDLREPFNPYSFPVRAPHLLEFGRLIDTATQLGEKRFGFLYSPGATGEKHLANVRRLLAERGLTLALALPLDPKASPADLAKKISDANVDIVFNHGSYATIAAIYKADRNFDRRTRFMAVNSGAQQMVKSLGETGSGLVFTQVVPFPWSTAFPIVRDYRAALAKIDPTAEPSFSSLEGYINARVLTLALNAVPAQRLSRASLVSALDSLGNPDIGGIRLHYSSRDHMGSSFVDTVVVKKNGQFVH